MKYKERSPQERLDYYKTSLPMWVDRLHYWESYTDKHIPMNEVQYLITHYRKKVDNARKRIQELSDQISSPDYQNWDSDTRRELDKKMGR